MAYTVSLATRNALCLTIINAINAGDAGSLPSIAFFEGDMPAGPDVDPGISPICTIFLNEIPFSTPTNGASNLLTTPNALTAMAGANADFAWCRFYNRDGEGVLDGTVSTTPSDESFYISLTHTTTNSTIVVNDISIVS